MTDEHDEHSNDPSHNKKVARKIIDRKECYCQFCKPNSGCNDRKRRPKSDVHKNKDRATVRKS